VTATGGRKSAAVPPPAANTAVCVHVIGAMPAFDIGNTAPDSLC